MSILPKARKGESKGGQTYIKGVTVRFGFDVLEPGKFERFVKNKATGTSYGVHMSYALDNSCNIVLQEIVWVYIYVYIIVGLSALLVSTNRAIPGP